MTPKLLCLLGRPYPGLPFIDHYTKFMSDYQALSSLIGDDVYECLRPETCVGKRNSLGGTSFAQVEIQLDTAEKLIAAEKERLPQS